MQHLDTSTLIFDINVSFVDTIVQIVVAEQRLHGIFYDSSYVI